METVQTSEAGRESGVMQTIGWLAGVEDGKAWIGLCRIADGDVEALRLFPVGEPPSPLQALAYCLDDALMYVGDPEDPAQSIEPIPGEVLATLGQPLYTAPLQLHADQIDAPTGGLYWQILDASDESTWRDVTAVVECEDINCEYGTDEDDDAPGCTVLVSEAYVHGFTHSPSNEFLSVRIPASVTA